MSHNPANLLVALAASRPATVERAQISSRRLKPFDNSQQSTRPAALPAAVSPSAGLPERLDSIHTPHPRNSNPHNPHRAIHVPHPAVSSLGGLRTPAPVCAAPPSWGRHPKTFTSTDLTALDCDVCFSSNRRHPISLGLPLIEISRLNAAHSGVTEQQSCSELTGFRA